MGYVICAGERVQVACPGPSPHTGAVARLTLSELVCGFNKLPYVLLIEFRPNDLALPRITRLTDDILPKSRMSRLR
jgi:hypothetical protein